ALGPARCGEAPALGDESQGFLEREHAGRNERGELTERVTRDESWPKGERKGRNATRIRAARRAVAELFVHGFDERLEDRHARCEHGRLCHRRAGELRRGALEEAQRYAGGKAGPAPSERGEDRNSTR